MTALQPHQQVHEYHEAGELQRIFPERRAEKISVRAPEGILAAREDVIGLGELPAPT
jgi:hypothetical protein